MPTPHPTPIDYWHEDHGPPALLKRLGNVVEAQLARGQLESAGIPSVVVGADAFNAAGRPTGASAGEVELWVPRGLVGDALDVLDVPDGLGGLPADGTADGLGGDWPADPFEDDPGRAFAFRAVVCAICGWLIVFLALPGIVLAVPTFLYALVLVATALRRSTMRDRGFRLQVVAATSIAVLGLAMAAAMLAFFTR